MSVSRAYRASIGIFKKQFYTFDFGNSKTVSSNEIGDFGNAYHIVVADVTSLDRPAIKAALSADANILTVGPIQFNLVTCSVTFRGMQIGPTTWMASEYTDTLTMSNLPATRDEIVCLVKSLIHLLESA